MTQDAVETTSEHAIAELRRLRSIKVAEITRLERIAGDSEDDARRYRDLAEQATAELASLDALLQEVAP